MNANLQFIPHSFIHCCIVQYEGNFPPKVKEETEHEDEGKMKEATGSGELLSRVQKLEDELKDSEQKRMDQIHTNMALQNKLKISQEEESRTRQEMASLKVKLVFGMTSQVSRIELGRETPDKPPRVLV